MSTKLEYTFKWKTLLISFESCPLEKGRKHKNGRVGFPEGISVGLGQRKHTEMGYALERK